MKKNTLILLILIVAISCDENDISQKITSYPMAVGSEWIYDRQLVIVTYKSETSDSIIGIDTMKFTNRIWIEKDTFLNKKKVTVFKSEETGFDEISTTYKYLDAEGLKTYAYSFDGAMLFISKKEVPARLSHSLFINDQFKNRVHSNGEIIVEHKPTLDIKLPLKQNSTWTYRYPSEINDLQIDKKVIGAEKLNLIGHNFACFKVQWIYLNKPYLISIKDWISKEGLIKREIIYDRETSANQNGEPIGLFQTTEYLTIKNLIIK